MIGQYSLGEAISNFFSLIYTKLFFRQARLIRRPIYIRGKNHFHYEAGLTTGYGCRFDLRGHGITLRIGKNCKMNDRVHIVAGNSVIIEDDVLFASNIFISDTSHGGFNDDSSDPSIPPDERVLTASKVHIMNRVWVGEGVCIMPGVTIGEGAIIGANSVVTHDIPASAVAAGCPARIIKKWNKTHRRWENSIHDLKQG